MTLLTLLVSMLQIGLFSFGGGYASLPLIQAQIVELHGWLTQSELSDIITIAEMTPGPLAINAATFVGIRTAGFVGALAATLGCVLPSCVIVLLLAKVYEKYRSLNAMQDVLSALRPAVVAMIASAGAGLLLQALFAGGVPSLRAENIDFLSLGIFALSMLLLKKCKCGPIVVMGTAGLVGLIAYLVVG